MFVDVVMMYVVMYLVSRNISVWVDKEVDYVNLVFFGEMFVLEMVRKFVMFMNDVLVKEKG